MRTTESPRILKAAWVVGTGSTSASVNWVENGIPSYPASTRTTGTVSNSVPYVRVVDWLPLDRARPSIICLATKPYHFELAGSQDGVTYTVLDSQDAIFYTDTYVLIFATTQHWYRFLRITLTTSETQSFPVEILTSYQRGRTSRATRILTST